MSPEPVTADPHQIPDADPAPTGGTGPGSVEPRPEPAHEPIPDSNPAPVDADGAPVEVPAPGVPGLAQLDPSLVRRLLAQVVASPSSEKLVTFSPLTGGELAQVPTSTVEDVERAVNTARAVQRAWSARPVSERAAILRKVHDLVLDRQSEAMDLVQSEAGKTRLSAFEEVSDVAINARFYARKGPSMIADKRRQGITPGLTWVREIRHPKGVVGVIAPWNYPLTLAVSDVLSALLAGNTVVLKPDSQTPLCGLWAAELLADAGLPEGVFQVVVGSGSVIGTALIDRVDHICFTGSTATGYIVAERAAKRLKSASLELGGKNSVYVAENADLERAAEAIVRDCFASAGQLCVSMERILVHDSIADAFLDRFLDRVRSMRIGGTLDFTKDMGALISPAHLQTVQAHVDDAVANGATLLAGGHARPDLGPNYYEPTVLADVPPTAHCYAEETFGPVVTIYRVHSDDEAIKFANNTEYGLNAAVWTKDLDRGRRIARQINTGTVSINEAFILTWGSVGAPMGGRGASGMGRRHGVEGLTRYTETQTIAAQRVVGLGLLYGRGGAFFSKTFTLLLRAARITRFPWP